MSINKPYCRSFGRIKTRKLSDNKKYLLGTLLPKYQNNFSEKIRNLNSNYSKLVIEVGFGFGDFLYDKALSNQETLYIGFEPHLNGVINILSKLNNDPLDNIIIVNDDFRNYIDKFELKSISEFYILFPDPWPKTKHFKRRIIDDNFLQKIHKLIIDDLFIATDHESYKLWIFLAILRSKNFILNNNSYENIVNFPENWVFTKYHKKALTENRQPIFLNLKPI